MAFKPTKSQENVLNSHKQRVVVSASAGSGKTTLMIEKLLKIITEDDADISKFLVCTFTNASSAEMKERLYAKMAECINAEKDSVKRKKLIENYEKIELAKIYTIDKMCLDVVKKYYYKLKIDANIQTLSDFEASFLKNRAFKLALEECERKSPQNIDLICAYFLQDRNDEKLRDLVYKLYENIQTRADGYDFLENVAVSLYVDDYKSSVILNSAIAEFDSSTQKILNYYITVASCLSEEDDAKLIKVLNGDISILQSYFNLDLENKIKFIFHNSVFSTRLPTTNSDYGEELKSVKNGYKTACTNMRSFLVTSDLKEMMELLAETKKMLLLLIDFLKIFKLKYDDLKLKQNQYEFIDIQHLALKLFSLEEVIDDFASDIDYVFVDEFQDVNYLQESLIDSLAKSGKLFLVGDAKQSIYGFRLCTPAILIKKMKDFSNDASGLSENLNENFRSDKCILDFVNQVFNCAMTEEESGVDYAKTSQLKGKDCFNNGTNFGEKVEIDILDFGQDEENSAQGEEENSKADDVLSENASRTNTQSVPLNQVANSVNADVAVGCDATNNAQRPNSGCATEGKAVNGVQVYDITRDVEKSHNKVLVEAEHIVERVTRALSQTIFDVKRGEVRQVDFKDIAILFRKRKALFVKVVELLGEKGYPVNASFKEDIYKSVEVMFVNSVLKLTLNFEDDIALATVLTFPCVNLTDADLTAIRLFGAEEKYFANATKRYASEKAGYIADKINSLTAFLCYLKKQIYVKNVYQIIKRIEQHFDLLNVLYSLNSKKIISNYQKFLNEIIGLEKYSVIDYLQYLQTRNQTECEITLSSGENCITCQTIHASKGLEYPIVILASAGDANKYRSSDLVITSEGLGADFYNIEEKWKKPTIVKNYIEASIKRGEIEELKRLLYVALTRPKNQLVVVGSCNVKKLLKEFREYAEPSFMQMILCYLKPFERETLENATELKNEFATIRIVKCGADKDCGTVQAESCKTQQVCFSKEQADFIARYINYQYPHAQNQNYAFKNSVSSILKSENVGENYAIEPRSLDVREHQFMPANELGTIYHAVLEKVDFFRDYSLEDVSALLKECGSVAISACLADVENVDNSTSVRAEFVENARNNAESDISATCGSSCADSAERVYVNGVSNAEKINISTLGAVAGCDEVAVEKIVNANQILSAINNIKSLISQGDKVLKEQPFIFKAKHLDVVASSCEEEVLVQGVIDLLIFKTNGQAVIVDYKNTAVKNPQLLAERYGKQLFLYSYATKLGYGVQDVKTYLYSIKQNELIPVDATKR